MGQRVGRSVERPKREPALLVDDGYPVGIGGSYSSHPAWGSGCTGIECRRRRHGVEV